MNTQTALLMVDLQNDFCPGGNLAVVEGDQTIVLANRLQPHFELVVATQDWHPADHLSFAVNHANRNVGEMISLNGIPQILWPAHCIQGSKGAEFHPLLDVNRIHKIIHKGTDKQIDSYSAFFDNAHLRATGLADYLHEKGVKKVYVMGLATDYCVKYTCLDAVKLGFEVGIIVDACRGVELQEGDVERAIGEMKEIGVRLVNSSKF
jgi:nicotinamidase/pyrazinamidase